ncbi:MAG: class I SAM-dependent methyltransferase [Chthoniobacterales bacterium]|nr:class I SAM-dependent methyltransferase [Chthoniobacterales bacterium]
MKKVVKSVINSLGYQITKVSPPPTPVENWPFDCTEADVRILRAILGFTMTGVSNQLQLIQAVRYIVRARIPGCFVECGVWRGGSSMAIAMALEQEGELNRDIYLFDTFEGMPPPGEKDNRFDGAAADTLLSQDPQKQGVFWAVAGLQEVQANVFSSGYPKDQLHFTKGPVEETLLDDPSKGAVALLRLDTDWYESTKCEMEHFFARVAPGGIVIFDDFGYWQGARRAVEEYLAAAGEEYFLLRIDETARLLIKR